MLSFIPGSSTFLQNPLSSCTDTLKWAGRAQNQPNHCLMIQGTHRACAKKPRCRILNLFISTQRLRLCAALQAYQFSAFVHFHRTKQHRRWNAVWHLYSEQALWCQKKHGRRDSVWPASSPICTNAGSPLMWLWYWLGVISPPFVQMQRQRNACTILFSATSVCCLRQKPQSTLG